MGAVLFALDQEFIALDKLSRELLAKLPDEQLFVKPREISMFSCGEYLVRSAAMVEKTFDGITTRLWDDPFEWTLPEKLGDRSGVLQYLDEVEATRVKAFGSFASDDDLNRNIPAPEQLRPLISVLVETLSHVVAKARSL